MSTTSIDFELDPLDLALRILFATVGNLPVHFGSVPGATAADHVIAADLPYLLVASGLGRSTSPRLGGALDRTGTFSGTFVHETYDGAKAVGLGVRRFLNGAPLTVAGRASRIRLEDPTDRDVAVSTDPTWTRPGGLPLFYGVDRFVVL